MDKEMWVRRLERPAPALRPALEREEGDERIGKQASGGRDFHNQEATSVVRVPQSSRGDPAGCVQQPTSTPPRPKGVEINHII